MSCHCLPPSFSGSQTRHVESRGCCGVWGESDFGRDYPLSRFHKAPEAILIDPRESWEGDKAGPKDSVFLFLLQVLLAPPGVPMALPQ